MHDLDTRRAILTLHAKGVSIRQSAKTLKVSRKTVRKVLASGVAEVPPLEREEHAAPWEARIRELYDLCEGNLRRVHEVLADEGKRLPYSTLTGFCRRRRIGVKPKERKGSYDFGPGEEMQHDTSPHQIVVGGNKGTYQCAGLALKYSRMRFIQLYPCWNRFYCKVFLDDAIRYFDGCCGRCMVDNSSVVLAHGSGANAVVAPEMEAFAARYPFQFVAHELGDANRSALVEGLFHYVERNFYPGRDFCDRTSLNAQAIAWCDKVNATHMRTIKARPIDLFAVEKQALAPLPAYLPEVYDVHHRVVDLEGFVTVHRNRYSVPEALLERRMVVRETKDRMRIFDGHREVANHERVDPGADARQLLPGHHSPRPRRKRREPTAEELLVRRAGPTLSAYVDALQRKHGGRAVRLVRELKRLYLEYPEEALEAAVAAALAYGMFDLQRLEPMVLRRIAREFFRLGTSDNGEETDE